MARNQMRCELLVSLVSVALAASVACKGDAPDGNAVTAKPVSVQAAGSSTVASTATAVVTKSDATTVSADEHVVWRLVDNRHTAHREVDGDLVIDGGAAGFARYTRFGLPKSKWIYRVAIDGADGTPPTFAARFPRTGNVELPLTAAQVGATSLWLRVHSTKVGKLSVRVGPEKGGVVRRATLTPGWQVISLAVQDVWKLGENDLQLSSDLDGDDVHIGWLTVSRKAADNSPTPSDPKPLERATFSADDQLTLQPGGGVSWFVLLPEASRRPTLVANVDGKIEVEVGAEAGPLNTAEFTGSGARLDLSSAGDTVVRLTVRNVGNGPATLRGAHIALAGPAAAVPPSGPPPKYVVWWIWDSTRADKIPLFQPGGRARTPNLAKLAETGAVFRQHYVGGNESQTSHSSMFTGLYPAVHEVRTAGNDIHFRLSHKIPTVGTLLSEAGYYTIGVTGNGYVGQFGGYSRGFSEFRNLMQEKHVVNARLPGKLLSDELIRRLDLHVTDDKPLFMYLGTVDSHSPWVARKPWIDEYHPEPYNGPFSEAALPGPLGMMKGKMGCHRIPPAREITRLRAIYDSTISYQDERLGELMAALERLGIADQTMIIVTADHGDELFEEKRCGHGASLRDSLARVPLVIHYPPRVATRVVDEGTEGIDILPTLLATVGAETPALIQGRSLLPVAAGTDAGWPTPSFASQYEYAFAARIGRFKARLMRGAPQIYDMVADPDERTDLATTHPYQRRMLTDQLALFLANRLVWKKSTWGVTSNMTPEGAAALDGAAKK